MMVKGQGRLSIHSLHNSSPYFFGLFLGLERSSGGFESFNFYCLIQVAIKNQSP